ncbi:hypothetical protein BZG36_02424 [Bifiguratus adelaidae]|uniref:Rgp1-domain-containing protein n=1 Tax=Bifiguratus adelaidae TaxID=1938954 RepID=A0A261Y3I7_9FUNG|nr:hypothetical protein BZG36_02424 [Bifiguratus adelaidae]
MTITVSVKFPTGGAFFAGEELTCTLHFANTGHAIERTNALSLPSPTSPTFAAGPYKYGHARSASASAKQLGNGHALTNARAGPAGKSMHDLRDNNNDSTAQKDDVDSGSSVDLPSDLISPRSSFDFYSIGGGESARPSIDLSSFLPPPHSSSAPSLPRKTELLYLATVQFIGYFVVDETMINGSEFDSIRNRTLRSQPNKAASSSLSGSFGFFRGRLGSPSGDPATRRNIPIVSTIPTILFVDLQLQPDEKKSYTYKLHLPNDLPPTHRGKAIRFHYNLVLTIQWGLSPNQIRSTNLPVRIFNHVSSDGSHPVYDLMNPIMMTNDPATTTPLGEDETKKAPVEGRKEQENQRKAFFQYVESLLEPGVKSERPSEMTRRESEAYSASHEQRTCIAIVSRLVSQSKRGYYDIGGADGLVARLHLLKTAVRLGEIFVGCLVFAGCTIPAYQVSITLESVEAIEPSIALKSKESVQRTSRKIHAQHHEFCANTARTSFTLAVPSLATPDFKTTGVRLQWHLRIEFITSKDTPYFTINRDDRHRQSQVAQELSASSFDCIIPVTVYGSANELGRHMYSAVQTFTVP